MNFGRSPSLDGRLYLTNEPGLQIDAALAHLASADAVMARLVREHSIDARHSEPRLFHALVSSIVSQQLSGRAAETIMRRVVALVAPDDELTPERVLAIDHEAFRAAGLSNAKGRYVRGLAEAVQKGELDLVRLPELDDEAVIAELTRVKGIGRWTAEMILLFSLERPNVLSTGDLGIRNAVKRHYALEQLPAPDELRRIAAPWHPYRSTALLLLWQSLESTPATLAADEAVSG